MVGCYRSGLFLILAGVWANNSWASAFGFVMSSPDVSLGESYVEYRDGQPQAPRFDVTVRVGEAFSLQAQSVVYPHTRGSHNQSPQPYPAAATAWLFDDTAFKLLPTNNNGATASQNAHTSSVRLLPLHPGRINIRYVGLTGGYERKYDFCIEILPNE